ncbi:MAG TPA: thermonuclease family protein, partial [Hyphomicrobium sp.]|nr:thermonuclease family protein [Hyphomicrobium sp.]
MLASAACTLFAAAGMTLAETDGEPSTCTLEAGAAGSVVRIIDAETVLLDGGIEVRLIGALAPRSPELSPDAQPWLPEEDATAALRELTLGRTVTLATSGRSRDRYGRNLAHLFIERDGDRVWVQGEMLRMGHARAYGIPGSHACMHELLAHENVARKA